MCPSEDCSFKEIALRSLAKCVGLIPIMISSSHPNKTCSRHDIAVKKIRLALNINHSLIYLICIALGSFLHFKTDS